jgi:protein TonB
MFEDTLLFDAARTNKSWTVCVSFAGQIALIGVAITLPLFFTEKLPKWQFVIGVSAPAPPPPPPPRPDGPPRVAKAVVRQYDGRHLFTPIAIPAKAAILVDEPLAAGASGVVGGVEGGQQSGVVNGVLTAVLTSVKELPPPPKPTPVAAEPPPKLQANTQPVRISRLEDARIVSRVLPVYPKPAKDMRIQGVVRLEGIISAEGRVVNLRVISGHPLLVNAALEAVKQWVYTPVILNGQPTPVITPIEVSFVLR